MTRLLVFVTGQAALSDQAVAVARLLREAGFDVEVVDVLEDPRWAEDFHGLATPAVVRVSPPPLRKVVGAVASPEAVLNALEVPPSDRPHLDQSRN